ncbi:MAG: hypothetical protein ACREBS_01630 [Nitrososphaerales archaeon]
MSKIISKGPPGSLGPNPPTYKGPTFIAKTPSPAANVPQDQFSWVIKRAPSGSSALRNPQVCSQSWGHDH